LHRAFGRAQGFVATHRWLRRRRRSGRHPARQVQPPLRRDRRRPAPDLLRQARLHTRLSAGAREKDMSEFRSVRQRLQGTTALRAAAILALAALAGCAAYGQAVVDTYPEDIRQRHPISLREGPKTLEVFVGINRGELSPAQRADLVAFAHTW